MVLGLGSNVGPSEATLVQAIGALRRFLGPLEVAPLYRSAPVSPIEQPDFLNTVVLATTRWRSGDATPQTPGPEAVLEFGQALEHAAGRRRGARFGPRPLDVDLLLFGDRTSDRPELTLPHPRMAQRRFVLAPLADLRPDLRLPPDGPTVRELLARLGPEQEVERLEWGA